MQPSFRRPALGLALALLPTTLAAQKQFNLPGNHVAVYNLAGEVTVVAGTGSSVGVAATVVGRDAGKVTFDETERGGKKTLIIRYPGDRIIYNAGHNGSSDLMVREDGTFGDQHGKNSRRSDYTKVRVTSSGSGLEAHADLRITVPPGASLDMYLGVGRISATNVNGNLRLDTSSGDVGVSGSKGDLIVDTGSGSVKVSDASGAAISIDTGSGDVEATSISAPDLSVDTGSGSVMLSQVTSRSVSIDTGSGDVELDQTGTVDRLDVDTGSGSVSVRVPASLSAQLAVETGSGDIETDFPVTVRRTGDDTLEGTIGTGAGRIEIDTGSGDVKLLKR